MAAYSAMVRSPCSSTNSWKIRRMRSRACTGAPGAGPAGLCPTRKDFRTVPSTGVGPDSGGTQSRYDGRCPGPERGARPSQSDLRAPRYGAPATSKFPSSALPQPGSNRNECGATHGPAPPWNSRFRSARQTKQRCQRLLQILPRHDLINVPVREMKLGGLEIRGHFVDLRLFGDAQSGKAPIMAPGSASTTSPSEPQLAVMLPMVGSVWTTTASSPARL